MFVLSMCNLFQFCSFFFFVSSVPKKAYYVNFLISPLNDLVCTIMFSTVLEEN